MGRKPAATRCRWVTCHCEHRHGAASCCCAIWTPPPPPSPLAEAASQGVACRVLGRDLRAGRVETAGRQAKGCGGGRGCFQAFQRPTGCSRQAAPGGWRQHAACPTGRPASLPARWGRPRAKRCAAAAPAPPRAPPPRRAPYPPPRRTCGTCGRRPRTAGGGLQGWGLRLARQTLSMKSN